MALPSSYRPSEGEDKCGNCRYLRVTGKREAPHCTRWDAPVRPAYTCDAWKPRTVTVTAEKRVTVAQG